MSADQNELPSPRGIIPPPFRSSRKSWMVSTQNSLLSDEDQNVAYQESDRIGYHPLIGSGGKGGYIVAHPTAINSNASYASPKSPVITTSKLPLFNVVLASYLISVVIVSVCANSLVMMATAKRRSPAERQKSNNFFRLTLALSDSVFALLIHTSMVVESLGVVDTESVFSGKACNFYGPGIMFFGTFTSCIHACLSIVRYINICHPEKDDWIESRYVYFMLFLSCIYSFSWALSPALEWRRMESFDVLCSVDEEKVLSNHKYVAIIFSVILSLPIGIVILCYALIAYKALYYQRELGKYIKRERGGQDKEKKNSPKGSSLLRSLKRKSEPNTKEEEDVEVRKTDGEETQLEETKSAAKPEPVLVFDKSSVRKIQMSLRIQAKLIRLSMLIAGFFILAWIPFAVVCLWITFGFSSSISEALRAGTALFYKSSTAFNPVIYFFMSESFRDNLRSLCGRSQSSMDVKQDVEIEIERHSSGSNISPKRLSVESLEVSNLSEKPVPPTTLTIPVLNIRRTSTSTQGSGGSEQSPTLSSISRRRSYSPGDKHVRGSLGSSPDNLPLRRISHTSTSSLLPINRMHSLPQPQSPVRRGSYVRRLSSSPYREMQSASRRSSVAVSDSQTLANGRKLVSSSSLRLQTKNSLKIDRNDRRALSQSFRVPSSSKSKNTQRRDSWLEPYQREGRSPKTAKEIQKDLESIIKNEFKGEVNLDMSNAQKITIPEGKLRLRSKSQSLNADFNLQREREALSRSGSRRSSRLSLRNSSRKGSACVCEPQTPGSKSFLEIPVITKNNLLDLPPSSGPVRTRSLYSKSSESRDSHRRNIHLTEFY